MEATAMENGSGYLGSNMVLETTKVEHTLLPIDALDSISRLESCKATALENGSGPGGAMESSGYPGSVVLEALQYST